MEGGRAGQPEPGEEAASCCPFGGAECLGQFLLKILSRELVIFGGLYGEIYVLISG